MAFDTDIFAYHNKPFAFYMEPQGYQKLPRKKPRMSSYLSLIPETVGVAQAFFESIPNRLEWGRHTESGKWITFTHYHERTGKDGRSFRVWQMALFDLVKHLAGRTAAIGAVDKFLPDQHVWNTVTCRTEPYIPRVRSLRIDVDMEDAYFRRDRQTVERQIGIERNVVSTFGLHYSVFRTGSKGHQIVIPLPITINIPTASCLMWMVKALLEERSTSGATVCADSLTNLMRLPGGVHGTSKNLGLWIDPHSVSLYPMRTQTQLMAEGLVRPLDPSPATLQPNEFQSAAKELYVYIKDKGVEKWRKLDTQQLETLAEDLPQNLFVSRFRSESAPLTVPAPMPQPADSTEPIAQPLDEEDAEIAEAVAKDRTWAEGFFARGYAPGHSWQYLRYFGILAAMMLAKTKREAERLLIEQAESIKPCPPDRIETIRKQVARFDPAYAHKTDAYLSGDLALLMAEVAKRIEGASIRADRRANLVRVAEVMLLEYQEVEVESREDADGFIRQPTVELSSRVIASRIDRRWGDSHISYKTVQRLIPLLSGAEGSVMALFFSLGELGDRNSNTYRLGRDARNFLKSVSASGVLKKDGSNEN